MTKVSVVTFILKIAIWILLLSGASFNHKHILFIFVKKLLESLNLLQLTDLVRSLNTEKKDNISHSIELEPLIGSDCKIILPYGLILFVCSSYNTVTSVFAYTCMFITDIDKW